MVRWQAHLHLHQQSTIDRKVPGHFFMVYCQDNTQVFTRMLSSQHIVLRHTRQQQPVRWYILFISNICQTTSNLVRKNILSKILQFWRLYMSLMYNFELFSSTKPKDTKNQFYSIICFVSKIRQKCVFFTKKRLYAILWLGLHFQSWLQQLRTIYQIFLGILFENLC